MQTLYLGDCLEIIPTLEPQSVDAIITDLPYGTTACKWDTIIPFEPMWQAVKHVLKPRGAFVTTASQPFTSALVMSNPKWFKYEWIWAKSKATGHLDSKRKPLKSHENIIVFCETGFPEYNPQMIKGERHHRGQKAQSKHTEVYGRFRFNLYYSDEYYPKTIQFENVQENAIHPTQKPVSLYEYLIKTYTNESDTVLDMTMGSGTTGVACCNTGRHFIGIEKDPAIFETARGRLESMAHLLFHMA